MLIQQNKVPNLEVGVVSILNCLDCAEILESKTVNLPVFPSLPPDQAAEQMVYQTIEFGCTIKAKDKLNKVRLVAPDQTIQQKMAAQMAAIIKRRT